MSISNLIKRLLFYPLGVIKGLHQLGMDHSRDLNNTTRFKKSIINDGSSFDDKTFLSSNSKVLTGCILNNVSLGEYSYISRNSLLQNVIIGKFCSISNDVIIGLGSHPIKNFTTSTLFYRRKNTFNIELIEEDLDFDEYDSIIIGNDVWIGARVIVMDGVKIGHGAVIAANSVVTKDVPPYAIVGGVPAKVLKFRFTDEKIRKLLQKGWWENDLQTIKSNIKNLNEL